MKRSLSLLKAGAAALAVLALSFFSSKVSAEDVDFTFDIVEVEPWQSVSIPLDHYDATKITPESEVLVEFTYYQVEDEDGEEVDPDECPINLIVQSWSNADSPKTSSTGGLWEKVVPYEWDATHAKFSYADMVEAFGTSDFTNLDAFNISATGHAMITPTSCRLTNVKKGIYIAMTDAERAEHYKNMVIVILCAALALIIVMIITFLIILKKKTSMVYDPTSGKYIDPSKMKKKTEPEEAEK